MSLDAKYITVAILSIAIITILGLVIATEKRHQIETKKVIISAKSAGCVKCHKSEYEGGPGYDPGIAAHWEASVHASQGIGCYDCHGIPNAGSGADLKNPRYIIKTSWDKESGLKTFEIVTQNGKPVDRPDIWNHEGAMIVTDVSPRTCARCHEEEYEQFLNSRHSSAMQFIGSVDNFLGRFAEGPAAAINGCQQCHGSEVQIAKAAEEKEPPGYAPDTWPNTGMGRINMDGSWGSCTACHSRHEFSAELARRPENCGKCHMGPDHPQIEIFTESKHGIAFAKNQHAMNMELPGEEWILGKDYNQAPTCATCHMGPVAPHANYEALQLTHDVGSRISWTLRPKFSIKPPAITKPDGSVILKDPDARREEMETVCRNCHADNWIENFYVQFDQAVALYNNKFAKPSSTIYDYLIKEGIIDNIPMNEEMDFVFYELWHHEGRRARHGASMMGPDYVQWHGFYELSKNFYTEFLPLCKELAEKAGKLEQTEIFIKKTLQGEDGTDWQKYHQWTEGLTDAQRESMMNWEKETYREKR
jgi:hydroxylamine dehydrogenase